MVVVDSNQEKYYASDNFELWTRQDIEEYIQRVYGIKPTEKVVKDFVKSEFFTEEEFERWVQNNLDLD